MPDVLVEIGGKKYRMACEEGQEQHLLDLAADFNRRVESFKGDFGEIGDARLTVMAGIAVIDELAEANARIESLKSDIAQLTTAGRELTLEAEEMEQKFARRLAEAARKVEAIATAIDETGSPIARAPLVRWNHRGCGCGGKGGCGGSSDSKRPPFGFNALVPDAGPGAALRVVHRDRRSTSCCRSLDAPSRPHATRFHQFEPSGVTG